MAQVKVTVNGQRYQLACRDGEEERLETLAAYVDGKIEELAQNMGSVGDGRLLLLASLVVADELHELRERYESDAPSADAAGRGLDPENAHRLDRVVKEVEDIAARLESA